MTPRAQTGPIPAIAGPRPARLRDRLYRWMFQLHGPQHVVTLIQRRVFIVPTRAGLVFALALVLMLVGSINFSLSLGFMLTFLLGAMGINGMILTFRNLAHLRVSAARAPAVFAGDTARFAVCLDNPGRSRRFSIGVTHDRRDITWWDIPARATVDAQLRVAATRRGVLRPGRFILFTRFPLGLFYAWSYVELDMQCVVYPCPEPGSPPWPPEQPAARSGGHAGDQQGLEDFAGLRAYRSGDSPRHVAWKSITRDGELLTKHFTGEADRELWLDWRDLPATMDVERRLSRLARWTLDLTTSGHRFGMRLPHAVIAPATGVAHRDRCLVALALLDTP
jgi:uncharacterized protein (DUF58 family)